MQTPRTGTTASAPEHDSSTVQLDGGEADRSTEAASAGHGEASPGTERGATPETGQPSGHLPVPDDAATPDGSRATADGSRATADPRRRTVVVAVAGLAFAVLLLTGLSLSIGAGEVGPGGVLVQAVTRNPLAETGLLGVNAGASLGVVAGIALLGFDSGYAYLVCAFVGAVVASGLVLLISGRRGGGSPMRLVLAGAALGATFGGLTSVIVVNSAETYDRFRFWVLGSLAGVEGFGELGRLAPVLALGFVVALLVARPLSALALG
ncbi:iron ABC transporter permease, partial [Streptomyces sp. MBT59]|uniref:FecCD family ABC transporter permease n=1 Tax=Streptomyces sp. MBT59 TaxID=1488390 RepID=UPI00191487C8